MASAIALRMRSGRFGREFSFGGINLLLNYEDGCHSGCSYCGLARSRPGCYEDKSFIRVEWPLVRTDDLVEQMVRYEPFLSRLCISMVTHGRAWLDTREITRQIAARVRTPLSVLVAPPTLRRGRLVELRSLGVDMIGIGLDAVTEDLFQAHRGEVRGSGLKWENYWRVLGEAREVFGPWKVNVHTVVGLGEDDSDLVSLITKLRDEQIFSYLFCFNPEPGSRMADAPKPSLRRWRRLQLARHLITTQGLCPEHFVFGANGEISALKAPPGAIEQALADGVAFLTNGCPGEKGEPGCTRPYGSYRPAEPFFDYPFLPEAADLAEIGHQLELDSLGQ
jgi:biotin synthase